MSGDERRCTCGFGGFHDDMNPRCIANWQAAGESAASVFDDRIHPDAARLRSLAATFDSHLNRGKTFLGAEVAAMLRDGGT